MISFINGFIIGVIVNKPVTNFIKRMIFESIDLFYKIKKKKKVEIKETFIDNIYFICKTNNFDKTMIQPNWDYYDKKGVIKIKFDSKIITLLNKEIKLNFNDLINLTTLDINFFKEIGEVYIYIDYLNKYTNVFKYNEFIELKELNEFKYNFICSTIQYNKTTFYLTKYLKRFINNKFLTPELLLLNYDNLNVPLNLVKFNLVVNEGIKNYLLNENLM